MLLTFELSSFRENVFLVLLHFLMLQPLVPLVGHLKAPEGRIEKTETHTHTGTQDNYCNPPRACVLRVNYLGCSSRVLLFPIGAKILPQDASKKELETTSKNT